MLEKRVNYKLFSLVFLLVFFVSFVSAFSLTGWSISVNGVTGWVIESRNCTLGDVNLDGILNVGDVTNISNYIIGNINLTEEQMCSADYNEDGAIDILDIVSLNTFILDGWQEEPQVCNNVCYFSNQNSSGVFEGYAGIYNIDLISATEMYATIKVTNPDGSLDTKEVYEGSSKRIGDLMIEVISSEVSGGVISVALNVRFEYASQGDLVDCNGICNLTNNNSVGVYEGIEGEYFIQLNAASDDEAVITLASPDGYLTVIDIPEGEERNVGNQLLIFMISTNSEGSFFSADLEVLSEIIEEDEDPSVYPFPFVYQGIADVAIIYGNSSNMSVLEIVEAGNIQADLMEYMGIDNQSGGNILVSSSDLYDVTNNNLIVVGSYCTNPAIWLLLGEDECDNSWQDNIMIGPGEILIESFANPFANKTMLYVIGYDAAGVVAASQYLRNNAIDTSIGSRYVLQFEINQSSNNQENQFQINNIESIQEEIKENNFLKFIVEEKEVIISLNDEGVVEIDDGFKANTRETLVLEGNKISIKTENGEDIKINIMPTQVMQSLIEEGKANEESKIELKLKEEIPYYNIKTKSKFLFFFYRTKTVNVHAQTGDDLGRNFGKWFS